MTNKVMRVVTMRVAPGSVATWAGAMRGQAAEHAARTPGLVSLSIGVRVGTDGVEGILTTVWTTIEAMQEAIGGQWEQPVLPDGLATIVDQIDVRHYDGVTVWPGPMADPGAQDGRD